MKTKHALLSIALTVALTLPLIGQHAHDDKTKTAMTKHDMAGMMGKPTVDVKVEGLHLRAWLMTQKQHKKMMDGKMGQMMMGEDMKEMKHDGMEMKDTSMGMGKDMKGMKHDGMQMDKATKEAMMAGTHCIMLDVKDATSGKALANASATVLIVSPSKMNASIKLNPMMSHFGNGLTLSEKGKYQFTISVDANGVSRTKEFQYTVK